MRLRMGSALPVKLTRDADGQVLHIPHGFELPGAEASIWQDGPRLVIEPKPDAQDNPNAALLALLATLSPIEDDFGPIEDLPPEPFDL